ncbi:MAG: hypothetical protein LAO51_04370 [Acidobacteriia bacterium]|nr:hypothetical protein [Terriglobia bacterium]
MTKPTVRSSLILLLALSGAASAAESDPHTPRFVALPAVHRSWGLGLRAVVEPNIVGRLDLAWGSEGLAVTTGIGYTF